MYVRYNMLSEISDPHEISSSFRGKVVFSENSTELRRIYVGTLSGTEIGEGIPSSQTP